MFASVLRHNKTQINFNANELGVVVKQTYFFLKKQWFYHNNDQHGPAEKSRRLLVVPIWEACQLKPITISRSPCSSPVCTFQGQCRHVETTALLEKIKNQDHSCRKRGFQGAPQMVETRDITLSSFRNEREGDQKVSLSPVP